MIVFLIIPAIIIAVVYGYMQQLKFGSTLVDKA